MKINYLICLLTLFTFNCFAQQTVERKGKLFNNLTEKYNVLADSPTVKQGLYQAIFNKKTAVASGQYTHGKKTGMWHFYDAKGTLRQHYNYDTGRVVYEAPEDTTSAIRYLLDYNFKPTDTVAKVLKPGGVYFGYLPYLAHFDMPDDLYGANMNVFYAVVELLVSPGGRLAEYKVRILSTFYNYNKVAKMSLDLLTEEEKQFIPAKLNGQPVPASIFITCRITSRGTLEYR